MLDTAYGVETPEGVALGVSPAGLPVRFLAWSIDFLIRAVVYLGLAMFLPSLGDFGVGLYVVTLFLVEWFYPVFFEIYYQGQSPGKRQMGIRVLQDNGVPIGWSSSLIRNLLRGVDFFPLMYGAGIVSMLVSKNFQRLGDLAAGTLVVYTTPPRVSAALGEVQSAPPPVHLHLEEQRAIVEFAERGPGLSEARAAELASIITQQTGASGEAATRRLYEIAAWIQGRR